MINRETIKTEGMLVVDDEAELYLYQSDTARLVKVRPLLGDSLGSEVCIIITKYKEVTGDQGK